MVSYPSYDNNLVMNSWSYYSKIAEDKSSPLTFRALTETRAPGSTFKMVTALAGLELGYIDKNHTVYDRYQYPNVNSVQKPVCWSRNSHGLVNVVRGLDVSCNYFFYDLGYRLSDPDPLTGAFRDAVGYEKLDTYATMLGLATKTNIELAEATPTVSTLDAVRSAIGQGTHSYTTANINRYTCTLANGGTVYNLYLVDRVQTASGEVLSKTEPVVDNVADVWSAPTVPNEFSVCWKSRGSLRLARLEQRRSLITGRTILFSQDLPAMRIQKSWPRSSFLMAAVPPMQHRHSAMLSLLIMTWIYPVNDWSICLRVFSTD